MQTFACVSSAAVVPGFGWMLLQAVERFGAQKDTGRGVSVCAGCADIPRGAPIRTDHSINDSLAHRFRCARIDSHNRRSSGNRVRFNVVGVIRRPGLVPSFGLIS